MAEGLHALPGVEMSPERTGPVPRRGGKLSADKSSDLISDYNPDPLPLT